jgi:hypothetical protein
VSKALAFWLATAVGLTPGCGTLFFHNPVNVEVHSNVNRALFTAAGEGRVGHVNGLIELDRTRDHTIQVTAPGYETRYARIETGFSWWRITLSCVLNLGMGFFTFFIWPFIAIPTDLGAGAWQCLDASELTVDLVPLSAPAAHLAFPVRALVTPCSYCGEPRRADGSPCPHCGMK